MNIFFSLAGLWFVICKTSLRLLQSPPPRLFIILPPYFPGEGTKKNIEFAFDPILQPLVALAFFNRSDKASTSYTLRSTNKNFGRRYAPSSCIVENSQGRDRDRILCTEEALSRYAGDNHAGQDTRKWHEYKRR
ncbi:hypothetical protein EV361DRAFT_894590 [Lentinula raphanica]|nr:hypothetical protein EV361DRAFT_894590 [Lentinula raphanica]